MHVQGVRVLSLAPAPTFALFAAAATFAAAPFAAATIAVAAVAAQPATGV